MLKTIMDHVEIVKQINLVNNQIKTLIERFCNDLGTITSDNDQIVRESVNIEQIRQVLCELAYIDKDLVFDREIIRAYLQEQNKC